MAEEGELWSMLPNDVTENILSRLSAFDIVRAGCTCKRLRAFISSHSLISYPFGSLLTFHKPWPESVWAYDGSRDTWLNLPLGFLLPDLPDFPHPIGSAGGLLCFGRCRDFVVCNPITRSCRKLPSLPPLVHTQDGQSFQVIVDENTVQAFGFTRNSITGTYELFVLHHADSESVKESRMLHYISSESHWRTMPSLVMREPGRLHINSITLCNSALYTLWETGNSLVVFRFLNGSWTEIESPQGIFASSKVTLMDVDGGLHMVKVVDGMLRNDEDHWWRCIMLIIWELHMESMKWIEATRMASRLAPLIYKQIDFVDLQFWGRNGMVYMKSYESDVVMCDLSRNEWKWSKGLDFHVGGLIFEPSLSACA